MNTQANVTSLPSTPKPQTAKEVIAANVKLLIEQLEAGHSEGLTAHLSAMGKFHNYSFGTPRNCPATPGRDSGRWALCVEPARPQGQKRRTRHPHSGAHDRHQAQEGC
jgi:hypothetical protein